MAFATTNYPIDRDSPLPIVCIDPGLRCVGIAVYNARGELEMAGLAESVVKPPIRGAPAWRAAGMAAKTWWASEWVSGSPTGGHSLPPQLVVVEEQKINDRRTRDPDDVLQCNGAAGALTMIFPDSIVRGVIPENWKGSVKKEDMTERIHRRLMDSHEMDRIVACPPRLLHNVLDACGIGLWLFGRLDPKHIFHRE